MKCSHRKVVAIVILGGILLASNRTVRGADGYEAMGHFTYSSFGPLGEPTYKNVMMFEVRVRGSNWWVRVEPVIECKAGVGFYEASRHTHNSVLMVTALEPAYKPTASPFRTLRAALKESKRDDVYFTSLQPATPRHYSDLFTGPAPFRENPAVPGKRATNSLDNAATAVLLSGECPPVDASYAALLAFAFTPPREKRDGGSKLLPQTWDDGNPRAIRLRRGDWKRLPDPPYLVSSAVYAWAGKESLPDGTLTSISTSDVTDPLEMAARYDVDGVTNVNGLTLPLNFSLTRFDTRQARRVVTTVVASVVSAGLCSSDEALEAEMTAKTFVSDYRLSAEGLKGGQLGYLLNSNALPSVEELKRSRRYQRALASSGVSAPTPYLRWILLCFLAVPPVVLLFWRSLSGRERRTGRSPEQTENTNT